jgi:nucleotide-binding universal stress UspA family protein
MFRTALLALDLSPAEAPLLGCMPALRSWGVERVVVVHVIRVGYAQGPQWHEGEQAQARIEAAAAPLRAAGLAVEVRVRAGVPADEILAAADEAGVDLIVIGSRSHNVAHRLFLGSVAREVIRNRAGRCCWSGSSPPPKARRRAARRCAAARCAGSCWRPTTRATRWWPSAPRWHWLSARSAWTR